MKIFCHFVFLISFCFFLKGYAYADQIILGNEPYPKNIKEVYKDEAWQFTNDVMKQILKEWSATALIKAIHPKILQKETKESFVKMIEDARYLGPYKDILAWKGFVSPATNLTSSPNIFRPSGSFDYLIKFNDENMVMHFDVQKYEDIGWKITYFCLLPPPEGYEK